MKRKNTWTHWSLTASVLTSYSVLLLALGRADRPGLGSLALLPVVVAAWFFGVKGGLGGAVFISLMKLGVAAFEEVPLEAGGFLPAWLAQTSVSLLVGAMVGSLRERVQAPRLSEERLKALLGALPDLMLRVSRDGVLLDAPPSSQFALTLAEPRRPGARLGELLPDVADQLMEKLERTLDTRKVQVLEFSSPLQNGLRSFEARFAVCGENEVLVVARDVTDRNWAAEMRLSLAKEQMARSVAEEGVRLRDEFLSVAAHELKTPITSLKLQVQAMLRARSDGGKLQESGERQRLEKFERSINRLASLSSRLLDVSRMSAGRLHLNLQEVDLAELVRHTVARYQRELSLAGCHPLLSLPPVLVGRWDRVRMEQVMENLLSNACKYGAGKPIEIELSESAGMVRLVVRDHGIGVAPKDQARIFERFERAVSPRHFGGLGLGLWMVRKVVESQAGQVSVHSALGSGATFTVTLPATLCRTDPEEKNERPRSRESAQRPQLAHV